jgi:hypothetical protein
MPLALADRLAERIGRPWRHALKQHVAGHAEQAMLAAEADHRRHAIIEQVIADLKNGPPAHLPSAKFMANSAWLVLAAIAYNLSKARSTIGTWLAPLKTRPAQSTQSAGNFAAFIASSAALQRFLCSGDGSCLLSNWTSCKASTAWTAIAALFLQVQEARVRGGIDLDDGSGVPVAGGVASGKQRVEVVYEPRAAHQRRRVERL